MTFHLQLIHYSLIGFSAFMIAITKYIQMVVIS